jgi:hypothetical protein
LGFWRKLLAFSGPGYLIAVGYMDPGKLGDRFGGRLAFRYALLSVIMISNLMAILLQSLALAFGNRHGARFGAGVPRSFFAAGCVRFVDFVRNRHYRLRFGGSYRLGNRAQFIVRHSADLGSVC